MRRSALLFLDNIYDTYGKGGKDNVWFASSPEIYEYLFTRLNSSLTKSIVGNHLVIRIKAAVLPHFYFRDLTLKLRAKGDVELSDLTFSENVTRGSYSVQGDSALINLSFSAFPLEMAEKYTARYETAPTTSSREEALHFVEMLTKEIQKPFMDRIQLSSVQFPVSDREPLFYSDGSSLHFLMEQDEDCVVCLYSTSGVQMKRKKMTASSQRLDVGDLPSGSYCIRVKGKQGVRSVIYVK